MENIDETSPEFEPLNSVLDNENSNDESISGMSDLVSVGSPTQFISKENYDTNSNGFEFDKSLVEKSQETFLDKNGIINHKSNSTNIKPIEDTEMSNNTEKLSTNDLKSKNKHHSSRTNKNINSQEKSSRHRSKDRNSSSHRSTSGEKNDIKKNNTSSKDHKNNSSRSSSHNRHHSTSKDKNKKHKRDKKSHHSDCDRTPKRDRKDSRSDKKEKSSSLCKEPKSLNGNRSDDESNAGGSSKQKSSVHKNKSSTSDKSKSSSSNHKNSRKDNGSKYVDDKPKDKSSSSKTYRTSINHKNNKIKQNKDKHSLKKGSKLRTDNLNIEKSNSKWNDLRSLFITNDEQDAANVLLSMSEISYENSINEIRTENIILLENSSTVETLKLPLNITDNKLKTQENINKNKILQSINNDEVKKKFNLEIPQLLNYNDNIYEDVPKNDPDRVDMVDIALSCKDIKMQNNCSDESLEMTTEPKQVELMVDEKKQNSLNVDLNLEVTQIANACDSIENLKVPKLKLKLLKEIDSITKKKRKRHHKNNNNHKKFKSSEKSSNETNTPIINSLATVTCKQNDHDLNNEIEIHKTTSTSDQMLYEEYENENIKTLDNDQSFNTFKGFSEIDTVPCENYKRLNKLFETLKMELHSNMNDGFKGFTETDVNAYIIYKNNHITKLKENGFIGFTEKETEISNEYKIVKQQLELAKKQDYLNNHQKNITCGGNGIQNGKKLNKVMAIIYENNKDNKTNTNENYSQPNITQNDCPVVNNNNHNITSSDDWVAEQETKYKLLPLKVKLERLLETRCNGKYILFICSIILI